MKKILPTSILGASAIALTLLFANASNATTWNFSGAPLAGGWKYDTSSRPKGNRRFGIQFKSKYVSTSGGKLVNKSGPMISSGTAEGGGIRKNGVFNSKSSGRCRAVGSGDPVKKSQASLWLHPNGANSMEIDFYEIKPNANWLNYIQWKGGSNYKPGKKNFKWGAHSTASQWATYGCTVNGARNKFTCSRNNKKYSYNVPSGTNVGTEIVAHNKPWRFSKTLANGPVATMECDWIKN